MPKHRKLEEKRAVNCLHSKIRHTHHTHKKMFLKTPFGKEQQYRASAKKKPWQKNKKAGSFSTLD